jgi:hypothetical protein
MSNVQESWVWEGVVYEPRVEDLCDTVDGGPPGGDDVACGRAGTAPPGHVKNVQDDGHNLDDHGVRE